MKIKHNREKGFSLVEFIVAMAVGLILMAGIVKIFQSNRATFKLQSEGEKVHNGGRFLITFLRTDLQMAGYSPGGANVQAIYAATDGVDGASDELTIEYESDVNCGGEATGLLDPASSTTLTRNKYFVSGYTFQCEAPEDVEGTKTYPLIEGVQSFQVLYGSDTSSPWDGKINVYQKAANVVDWNKVIGLQFALLLKSDPMLGPKQGGVFKLLNEQPVGPFTDGRLRVVYATTLVLRNRIPY